MDTDTSGCAEHRAAEQAMSIEVRTPRPKASDEITEDLISIGQTINAVGLIVSFGDDDGYEHYLATHWGEPGDPD